VYNAIGREKDIKLMKREAKEALIKEINPDGRFFNVEVCGEWPPKFEGRLRGEKGLNDESGA
jgi:hypothetical protein